MERSRIDEKRGRLPSVLGSDRAKIGCVSDGDEQPVDPGWRDAWTGILWIPTLFLMQQRLRRSKLPALILMRRTFVMFGGSLATFGIIRVALGSTDVGWSSGSAATAGVAIVVIGLAVQFVVARFLDPPLPCGAPAAVAAGYRAKFFLKVAFAEAPSLFGFTLSFVSGFWWVYLFGLIPTGVGLVRAAPTRASVEREWRDLNDRGCDVNLLAALMTPPASG